MELQTAGRAVTITPFTSIQTFWGTGEAEERGRESERGGELTACMTQGESLDLNILCVRLWAGWGCGETEKICAQAHATDKNSGKKTGN